jgi:hypothetical protein
MLFLNVAALKGYLEGVHLLRNTFIITTMLPHVRLRILYKVLLIQQFLKSTDIRLITGIYIS